MEKAALQAEKERSSRFQKDRDDDFKQGDEAMDTKFKRLEYLLSQSEVSIRGLKMLDHTFVLPQSGLTIAGLLVDLDDQNQGAARCSSGG